MCAMCDSVRSLLILQEPVYRTNKHIYVFVVVSERMLERARESACVCALYIYLCALYVRYISIFQTCVIYLFFTRTHSLYIYRYIYIHRYIYIRYISIYISISIEIDRAWKDIYIFIYTSTAHYISIHPSNIYIYTPIQIYTSIYYICISIHL